MKEKAVKGCLTTFVLVIIIFFIFFMLTSCSTTKTFAQKEKELCTPNYDYFKITACDSNYIWLEGKKKPLKNEFKKDYKVGSYLVFEYNFSRY